MHYFLVCLDVGWQGGDRSWQYLNYVLSYVSINLRFTVFSVSGFTHGPSLGDPFHGTCNIVLFTDVSHTACRSICRLIEWRHQLVIYIYIYHEIVHKVHNKKQMKKTRKNKMKILCSYSRLTQLTNNVGCVCGPSMCVVYKYSFCCSMVSSQFSVLGYAYEKKNCIGN